jgi:putative hemolysin
MSAAAQRVRISPGLFLVNTNFAHASEIVKGRYAVRVARTNDEVISALKLRFEVFNVELGEGHASSFRTGREFDEFDLASQHLILIDRSHQRVIGTCRLLTYDVAKQIHGFYSSREFDISTLPHDVLLNAMEVGRFCIAKAHRNARTYALLLKGLGLCLRENKKRYIFGSISLATQDPMEAGQIFDQLSREGHVHSQFWTRPKTGFKCLWYSAPEARRSNVTISNWFRICLRLGTKLCGLPAINRQFRSIDFPVFLDIEQLGSRKRRALLDA